jgi:hypothetical protein
MLVALRVKLFTLAVLTSGRGADTVGSGAQDTFTFPELPFTTVKLNIADPDFLTIFAPVKKPHGSD